MRLVYALLVGGVLSAAVTSSAYAQTTVAAAPQAPAKPAPPPPGKPQAPPPAKPPASPPTPARPNAPRRGQPLLSGGFLVVNGGYQLTATDFAVGQTIQANAEAGRVTSDYAVKRGPALDVAGGVVLKQRFAVGAALTRFSTSTPTAVNAQVPHPFFFNRSRDVNGDVTGLRREELALHVQARAIAPVGRRMQVTAFGGPSFFSVRQHFVTNITWADSYPYDVATFAGATTADASGSKLGFNAGADVAYFFSRRLGVGATLQVARATVQLPVGAGTHDVSAGGATVGGGLRIRF